MLFQLRRIAKIRSYLSVDSVNKLCIALILSRLDYCNSLLADLPDKLMYKLQRIQNHAARLVLRKTRRSNASELLRTLHWLPVRARIEYKISIICFQIVTLNCMPSYLSDLVCHYTPSRTLRSQDENLLSVPRFSLNFFGKRSFSVFGPITWNSLPSTLRQIQSLATFKKQLKTHLFRKYL